jgi:UDP-N-acetylmuramoyl-tripeptide--D-alanyl-D-alanine ligase
MYKAQPVVTTDSRNCPEDSIFFALRGATFDGNAYAIQALEKGCAYAVVDNPEVAGQDSRLILVDDVLTALQKLAAHHRRAWGGTVLQITGTNGKTTTKELIAAVLSEGKRVLYTQGNLNNHIGVPLTLFGLNAKTRAAVIEMGASAPGEIATLVKLAQPTCGLITNVGKAHILGFGSFEGVKRTKGELYDYLRQNGGLAFYNADNPHLCEMIASRSGLQHEAYGVQKQGVEVLEVTAEHPFLRFRLPDGVEVETNLVGAYNADNALAALCVGAHFGVPQADAIAAIAAYRPANDRSQMVRTGRNTLIVDTYNANPTSMGVALDNFAKTSFAEKTLILGDMLELGGESATEHSAALAKAMSLSNSIFLVGREFADAAAKVHCAQAKGIQCFPNSVELRAFLEAKPLSGRTILIKGSHGIHLEKLPEVL